MRSGSPLLSPILTTNGDSANTFTAIDYFQSIARSVYKEGGTLSNADQRYILAKLIQKQYAKDSIRQKAMYAMRYDLFDLFQTLLFNEIPMAAETIKLIQTDFSDVEADIFRLYQLFVNAISAMTSNTATEEERKAG